MRTELIEQHQRENTNMDGVANLQPWLHIDIVSLQCFPNRENGVRLTAKTVFQFYSFQYSFLKLLNLTEKFEGNEGTKRISQKSWQI